MLTPHAVDIGVTISSLIPSLCFTFAEPFHNIFSSSSEVVHWSAEKETKVYDPRIDPPTHRPTKQVNSRSLTKLLFCILQNSRKMRICCKWHLHFCNKVCYVKTFSKFEATSLFSCLSAHGMTASCGLASIWMASAALWCPMDPVWLLRESVT